MEGADEKNSRIILKKKLQHMVAWMQYYNIENDNIPNTTEEQENDTSEDIFNNFEDDSITTKNEIKEEDTASRNQKIKIILEYRFLCWATHILM